MHATASEPARAGQRHRGAQDGAVAEMDAVEDAERDGARPRVRREGLESPDDPHEGSAPAACARPPSTSPTPISGPSTAWTRTSAAAGRRAGVSSTGCPWPKRLIGPARPAGRPATRPARPPAGARAPREQAPRRDGQRLPRHRVGAARRDRPACAPVARRRPAAERRAEIGREHAHVRSLAAHDAERRPGGRDLLDLDRVDHHLARLALDLDALPRQLVEAAALVVDGRVHRRHLLDPAHERAAGRLHLRPVDVVTGASASTRPLRSCVSVVTPRRRIATYSLS